MNKNNNNKNKYGFGFTLLLAVLTLSLAMPVLAENNGNKMPNGKSNNSINGEVRGNGLKLGLDHVKGTAKPVITGKVTAVNGNILTVSGRTGLEREKMMATNTATTTTAIAAVTYTVDATNAKVYKNNVVSTLSGIALGDTIIVQGTLTGTNIVATTIRDGVMMGNKEDNNQGQLPPQIVGNGQPVVAGKISSITGSTFVMTNTSNVTYTVDATNAKVYKNDILGTISSLVIGDNTIVQGTVNGTSITASTVIDQVKSINNINTLPVNKERKGFFGSIGNFFGRIFGF